MLTTKYISKTYGGQTQLLEMPKIIGDNSIMCIEKEMQPSGENQVWLNIVFVHKNVAHQILGWGLEYEVTEEFMVNIAQIAYDKLIAFGLSDTVTFQP